jgi:hypothetical protein
VIALHTCTGTHNSGPRVDLFPEGSQDFFAICWRSHLDENGMRSCSVLDGLGAIYKNEDALRIGC